MEEDYRRQIWVDSQQLAAKSKKSSKFSPWKYIDKNRSFFERNISCKLESEDKICFWEDSQATNRPFCETFPPIYALLNSKKLFVGLCWSMEVGAWNLMFRKGLSNREMEEQDGLTLILEKKKPKKKKDQKCWVNQFFGIFSIKIASKFPVVLKHELSSLSGKGRSPKKVKFFIRFHSHGSDT